jgi:PAS domain S-box-containing protein
MTGIHVLYIEDDAEQRESLSRGLTERGFEVVSASSGREGLALLSRAESRADVVLCDLNMPEMDGLAVLDEVRTADPDLPFVLLTAHPSVPLAVKAITEGAHRFLIKPVGIDEMEITIHQALEYARLHRWQREAEEQLVRLVEVAPVPYIVSRLPDGEILYANRHLGQLVGLRADELRGRNVVDFYYDIEDRKKVLDLLRDQGFVKDLEVRIKRADGNPLWTVFSLARSEMAGQDVVLGGFLDITRRKEMEEKLRIYHEVFRHSVDVILVLDSEGHIVERNPAHEKRTGFTDQDIAGKSAYDFMGAGHKLAIKETIQKEGSYRGEAEAYIKDGTRIPVDVSIFPIHDENGELDLYVGMGRDMTAIKKALTELADKNRELRDTQSQLVQSEKMASLGGLVAGIAHEINTPVGAVGSMHDTLLRGVEKLKEHLASKNEKIFEEDRRLKNLFDVIDDANQVIKSGTGRVAEIVRRLRSFARLDEAELKKVDIHEGLEDTLTLIHHEIKHHVIVKREYGDIPPISIYPSRINQVFLNLLNNARQAIREKGTITIRTGTEGDQAFVSIEDDGVGIPEDNLKKIFDPGFTTKGVGVGTGLGLSICYQIVNDHRGTIDVESTVGKGTKFTVRIPMNLDQILGVS